MLLPTKIHLKKKIVKRPIFDKGSRALKGDGSCQYFMPPFSCLSDTLQAARRGKKLQKYVEDKAYVLGNELHRNICDIRVLMIML